MSIAKIILYISAVSALIAYAIYTKLVFQNKIKPHTITYLVWTIILGLNFIIQLTSGVGVGSILLGCNFLGCFLIFILCYQKGYMNYDKLDWFCFMLAILAVVLWLISKTPIYSVILSCVIDLLAILPSFRKSFIKPWDDSPIAYWTSGLEYLASLPSYQVFSIITLLYPVSIITIDFLYSALIAIRRLVLKTKPI